MRVHLPSARELRLRLRVVRLRLRVLRLRLPAPRSRIALVAALVFAAMVVAAVVLLLTLPGSGHKSRAASSPPSSATVSDTSSNPFPAIPLPPTDTSGGSGSSTATPSASASPVTEEDARATVVSYINDVNTKDRVSAGKLICTQLYDAWLQNIDAANSDFNFQIVNARFTGSDGAAGGARIAHYALTFNDGTVSNVDFTLIDQGGPKICGEARS